MVAIITGEGFGLERSSAFVLGSRGQVGSATLGRDAESVFVNAANGNLVITRRDEFLIGRGPDAAIGTTYNSQTTGDGDNADGWRSSVYRKISGLPVTYGAAGSTVKRFDWDGSDTIYTWNAAENAYVTTDGSGAYDKLTRSGVIWTWTDGNSRVTELYDETKFGLITTSTDTDGNSLTYTFNSSTGQLNQVVSLNGGGAEIERVDLVYDGTKLTQLLTTKNNGTLTRVRYGYETYAGGSATRLVTVEVDLSPENNSVADGNKYLTTYTYADTTSTRVASIAQQDGSLLQIAYTQIGSEYRVTKLTETVSSGITRVTGLFYDTTNRITIITDPLGGVTTMTYDVKGNLTQLVLPVPVPGAAAPTTSFVYNANGDVESMTENGRMTAYTYDSKGNMTLSRDAAGNTVRRTYGAKNELLTDAHFLMPDPDGAGGGAATTPVTSRYAYDGENHLRFAVSAEGEVKEYRYDAPGRLTSTIVYPAHTYNVAPLAWDTGIAVSLLESWVTNIADKSSVRRVDTTYDFRGNVDTVTNYSAADSLGNGLLSSAYSRDTYVYNQAGQLIDRYNNASAAIEHFVYDGLGRLISSTDMAGGTTTFAFNDAASTTTVTFANGLTRASVYNKAGERISMTESGANITTAVTTEQYDGLGRLRKTTDPTGRSTYFLYDNASRKVADVTADGAITEYGYDSSHRLVKTIAYINKLDANQIASLSNFTAGGAGGANAGGGGSGGPVGSTLLVNGSFDTPGTGGSTLAHGLSSTSLTGWTKANGQNFEQVLAGQFSVTGTDGTYWLDLDSVPGSGQTLPTGPNLLTNGSFDTLGTGGSGLSHPNLLGWNRVNAENFDQIAAGTLGITGTDGAYWLDLDSVPGSGYVATGSNLLVNGSFDTVGTGGSGLSHPNLLGWNKVNGENFDQIAAGTLGVTGTTGAYWLDMDSVATGGVNPNLIVNGSFEQSAASYTTTGTGRYNDPSMNIPGWVKINALGFEQLNSGVGGTNATDGAFYLDMDSTGAPGSNMDISQTLSGLTAGQAYTLKFDYANIAGFVGDEWDSSGSLEVLWNGTVIAYVGTQNVNMTTKTYTVTATGATGTLRFRETGIRDGVGCLIDNVRLTSNAAPAGGGNMDINQVIPNLTAGQMMQLQFDHANRTTTGSGGFEVYWNGTLVDTITTSTLAMQTKTYFRAAVAGNNTLRFKGIGTVDAVGASLDNVRVYATTTPPGGGNMDINQSVNLTAGETIQIQFNHANRTTTASGGFEVYWNGTLIDTITTSTMAMQTKTYTRTAIAGTNTLRFKGIGTVDAVGASIDNVRLYRTFVDVGGGNMDISQAVPNLTAGQSLQLQFNHANRTSTASGGFEVWWNTIKLATITNSTMAMQPELYNVTAQAGTNTVRFVGIGTVDAVGASIDNVRLFAIQGAPTPPTPAPTTDALAGMRPLASPTKDAWTWRIYDNADRLLETIDATGAATVFAYDGDSRVLSSKSYANAIAAATITGFKTTTPTAVVTPNANAVTDRLTRNFYDNDGRVVAMLDGAGGLTQFVYDEAGFKVRELGAAKAAASNLWAAGLLSELVTSVGTSTSDRRTDFVYDGRGLLRFAIDATAKPVEYVYDTNDNVIRTIDYAGSIAATASYSLAYVTAQLTSTGLASNPANRISRTVYDAAGRAAFSIDATGAVLAFGYDAASRVIKQTAYATVYTVPGDQILATMQSWATGQAGNAANRVSRIVYDAAGRIAYEVDAETYVTEHQYDTAGRVTKDIRYAAQYPTIADGVTKTTLAALIGGLPTDAISTVYGYDAAGRLTDVTRDVAAGVTSVTHFVLDGLGQATDTIDAYNSATDASTTRRVFDAGGRVISETRGFGTTEAATTLFDYDRVGNLLTVTDPRNFPTTREYDTLGRVVKVTTQVDGNSLNNIVVTSQYDAFGNIVKIRDARLNDSFAYYDSLGRAWLRVDAEGYATKTVYTAFSQAETVTRYWTRPIGTPAVNAPPTIVTNAAKDSATRLDYDRLGRITKTTDAEGHYEQYTLDAFGDRQQVRNKLGGIVINTFDRRGQLKSETLPMVAQDMWGNVVAATVINRFDYDARGNRTKTTEADGLAEKRVTNFVYDKAGRLVEKYGESVRKSQHFEFGVPSTKYKYDLRGNVIEVTDPNNYRTLSYYDALDRKTVEINAAGAMSTFLYDRNGNVERGRLYGTAVALPGAAGGIPPGPPAGEYREMLYAYDGANRLKESTIVGVRAGERIGSAYSHSVVNLLTTYNYDTNGNVLTKTGPDNAATNFYYDKLNRRTGQLDPERFLTIFELDAEGNALSERRYSTQSASVSTGTPPSVPTNAADRVTIFEYDRNGRRTSESRQGVEAYTVDAVSGEIIPASTVSTIGYQYNGMGEVTRKTEATGEYTDYVYDLAGRLTKETRPALKEFGSSDWSWPTTDYAYNGINNLTMTRQGKEVLRASDRYTRFEYDIGGRLTKTTDAALNTREHFYDLAGNLVAQKWYRTGSTYGYEGGVYVRDALGRVTEQRMYDVEGFSWNATPNYTVTAYNVYGEMSARSLNRPVASAQERFVYDAAGRLAGTNSGDGVWRYFVFDKAGNQTLVIESEGADLTNQAVDTVLSTAANAIAGGFTDGINVTTTVYDKRGLAKDTRQTQRELKIGDPRVTLATERTYNAFGEVISERDARLNTTYFEYNTMGRTTRTIRPQVLAVDVHGAQTTVTPTERQFYDSSGRLIGSETPNGGRTSRALIAGSGYGGSQALTGWEYHDDGILKNGYDVFGDLRGVTNEVFATTAMQYDGMGRLTRTDHAIGLVETFTYDQLGQRIGQSNSVLGTAETGYDIMGRVIRQEAMSTDGIGDVTTFVRTWVDGETSGIGAYGAYFTETTYANAMTSNETTDQFGHILASSNMSGYTFSTITYDKAGRQTNRVTGLMTANYVWLNSGLVGSAAVYDFQGLVWETRTASYGYDANGNKLSEYAIRDNAGAITVMQNATAQYDAMNRLTYWAEAGNASIGAASTQIWYDPNSNIRHSYHQYAQVNSTGNSYTRTQDYWFAYDSMDRLVLDKGVLTGPAGNPATFMVRGVLGTEYQYDAAGRRGVALRTLGFNTEEETYFYRADNALEAVWISPNTDHPDDEATYGYNRLKSRFTYDLAGRQLTQTDFLSDGQVYAPGVPPPHNQVAYFRTVTYNNKGQIAFEQTVSSVAGQPNRADSTYEYTDASGNYYLGQAARVTSSNYRNGTFQSSTVTTNMYSWYDGPSLLQTQVSTTTGGTTQHAFSAYEYATGGVVQAVSVTGQIPRYITYLTDINGQTVRRDEGAIGTVKPHEVWYRFNGKEMGYSGNNGTEGTNYQWSIDNRTIQPLSNPGPFRFGQNSHPGLEQADFAQSVSPYTSFNPGSSAGGYIVRGGETLASIASALWGDSGLWFKLAQANGLSSPSASLIEGQRLNVPPGVARNSHNASTFKPYDPSETLGDTSANPLAPKPKNGNKCGIVGMILLVAIAVAVTAITAGAAVAALTPGMSLLTGITTFATAGASFGTMVAAGAIGGAMGSIASQGFGVATGIQEKFSWKGVAMGALAGGITAGIGASGAFAHMGTFARGALSAASSSALSQGIGVAIGLQDKFDWVGVAAAGLAGGVSASVGAKLGGVNQHVARFISGSAGAIAGAATRSLLAGTDFGDNLLAALPDVIGTTLGNLIVDGITSIGTRPRVVSDDLALLAGGGTPSDTTKPTLASLTALYGATKAQQMMDLFNATMGTRVTSSGEIKMTPAMRAYLRAHAPSGADVRAEALRLLEAAKNGNLRAFYDFGYTTNAATRYDTSTTSIGDERRAAELTLRHQGLQPTPQDIALLRARVFGGDNNVVYPAQTKNQFRRAADDLRTFIRNRNRFLDGLARSSLTVNALIGYSATIPTNTTFRTSVGEMRAAIDQGYFTLRPFMSLTGMDVKMQQYNAGANSEIIVYREGFALGRSLFARAMLHELVHAQSANDALKLIATNSGQRSTTYDPDPKTYYDRENQRLITGVNPGGSGPAPPGMGTVPTNYETGFLHEGNVLNWWSKEVLQALRLY